MSTPGREAVPAGSARDAAAHIVRTLRQAGFVAFFAGGCVRDELLGRVPNDYDVATDATPAVVAKLFPRHQEVGAHFGVMLVKQRVRDSIEVIEVATFRADGTYSDARRPDSVRFASPHEDARRRDFTINALFLDPMGEVADHEPAVHAATLERTPGGTVIDFVGGLGDLRAGVLRAVGDPEQRLAEDHLRALRAVRLSARLGFPIDPDTARAISRHATDLVGVSRERVGDEVRAMLGASSAGARVKALDLLRDLGLEKPVFALPAPLVLPGSWRIVHEVAASGSVALVLAGLVVDAGLAVGAQAGAEVRGAIARAVGGLRGSLCLSNHERDEVTWALEGCQGYFGGWMGEPVAFQKRFLASSRGILGLALLRAVDASRADRAQARRDALAADGVGLSPPPLLTGDHLVELGMRPGPMFKALLEQVYDLQLEGIVRDRAGATAKALELARMRGV